MVAAAGVCDSRSVYGGSSSQGTAVVGKDILSDTDEPSLDSRVDDNVMAVVYDLLNHVLRLGVPW